MQIASKHLSHINEYCKSQEKLIPKFWSTQTEIKEALKAKQEADEMQVLNILANRAINPSVACKIFTGWELGRKKRKLFRDH